MFLLRSAAGRISNINLLIEPISAFDKALFSAQRRGLLAAVKAGGGGCGNRQEETFKVQNRYQQLRGFSSGTLKMKHLPAMISFQKRTICTHEITKNLTLFSDKPRNVDKDPKTLRLKEPIDAPLVLIFGWLLAKKKHLAKYVKLYTDQGFDALAIDVTPWQLLWPAKGAQIVAENVVKFLENNKSYDPMVIHGFSVGGYVFGEVMLHMSRDMKRYQPILDRIVAQVWDSAADLTEIPFGFPKAVFPKTPKLQKVLKNYIEYHLKTFHHQATVHYIRSSQLFHSTLVQAPALFFLSKNDPIGAEKSNLVAKESYERAGIKVTWKCWDRSSHVLHYQKHPDEYKTLLQQHLEENARPKIMQKRSLEI